MTGTQIIKAQSLLLGFSATLWQILLLRAFMTIFYGNELIIGFLLCGWLLFVAFGCWIHDRRPSLKISYVHLMTAFVAAIFLIFTSSKFSRLLLQTPMGEFISLPHMAMFAAPCLAFGCIILGYGYGCLVACLARQSINNPAVKVYIYESCGATIAGLLFTFVLASRVSDFIIVMMLAILIFCCIAVLQKQRWPLVLAIMAMVVTVVYGKKIDFSLSAFYWRSVAPGLELKNAWTSRYGEWAILDWHGEKNLYCNGLKQTVLPDPIENQTLAALLLTQNPGAHRLLLIGGGWGGLAQELTKQDNLDLTYVEMDEKTYYAVIQHRSLVNDGRLCFQDGRRFLQQNEKNFDLIVVNVGRPTTALINRYYTREFFQLAAKRLTPKGVLALTSVPSGENILGAGLKQLNSAVWWGLRSVFNATLPIPGDQAHYFACKASSQLCSNPDSLARRYEELHRQDAHFHPALFEHLLQSERRTNFVQLLEVQVNHNTDMHPVSYYTDLLIWLKQASGLEMGFTWPWEWMWPALILLCLLVRCACRLHAKNSSPILLIMFLGGSLSLSINIIFLLMLQSIYGYVYEGMGAAMALYMAGMAFSAWCFDRSKPNPRFWLPLVLFITMFFLVTLLLIFHFQAQHISLVLFLVLIGFAGMLTGAPFPLATQLDLCSKSVKHRTRIYAADLLGAAVGSLWVNTFSIPLFGFSSTMLWLTALSAWAGLMSIEVRTKAAHGHG